MIFRRPGGLICVRWRGGWSIEVWPGGPCGERRAPGRYKDAQHRPVASARRSAKAGGHREGRLIETGRRRQRAAGDRERAMPVAIAGAMTIARSGVARADHGRLRFSATKGREIGMSFVKKNYPFFKKNFSGISRDFSGCWTTGHEGQTPKVLVPPGSATRGPHRTACAGHGRTGKVIASWSRPRTAPGRPGGV